MRARILRNPYNKMSYEELTRLLKQYEAEYKTTQLNANSEEDFAKCSQLKRDIVDIKMWRSKLPVPELVPTNRRETDLYLSAIHLAINKAVQNNKSSEEEDLKAKQRRLEAFLVQFPTVDEVTLQLNDLRLKLSNAKTQNEWDLCTTLKSKIAKEETQLENLLKSGEGLRPSVDDLKSKKYSLETEIEEWKAKERYKCKQSVDVTFWKFVTQLITFTLN